MKKFFLLTGGLILFAVIGVTQAAPSEVLSEVSYIVKDGINAVRVDFALPIQYVSHSPDSRGKRLTINIRFEGKGVADTSELPLMQSLYPAQNAIGPLVDVVYETIGGQPQLQLNFKTEVEFRPSQAGASSLLVWLPEKIPAVLSQPVASTATAAVAKPATEASPPAAPIDPNAPDTETDLQAKKMVEQGRNSLRKGSNQGAIQTFTAVLSLPANKYSQTALELLGVARERNHQNAQANAIYTQYLQQYPDGEGAVRVRQRQAELLAAQLKPQRKLKESPRAEADKKRPSAFFGNLTQYLDHRDIQTETDGRVAQYQSLETLLSLGWRGRSGDWDIYNYFFGDHQTDLLDDGSDTGNDGAEISSLYSRIKNRKAGFYATIGRQPGISAGAYQRFDGVYAGYDVQPKIRVNTVLGYPVDTFNEQTIQSNKPMLGLGADFFDLIKGVDVSPYIIQQQVDGITDRKAIGAEARYFKPEYNIFGRIDYDIAYSDLNLFFLQTQIALQKSTSFFVTFDHRKSPFLETSNALIQVGEDVTVQDLLDGSKTSSAYTETQLQNIAADRTGTSTMLAINVSHTFNPRQQVTAELSRLEQSVKVVNLTTNDPSLDDILQSSADTDTSEQWDAALQWVSKEVFYGKDTAINSLRFSFGDTFNESAYSLAYRIPSYFQWEPRLLFRYRTDDSGETLFRAVPGVRVNYRALQQLQFFMEFNYELWDFGGDTQQEDFSSTDFYMGYSWTF